MEIQLEEYNEGKPLLVESPQINEQIQKLREEKKWKQIYKLAEQLKEREKYLVRVNALYHMKRWKELQQYCDKGISKYPQSDFYNLKGRAVGKFGRHQEKVKLTLKAIEIDDTIPAYHRNLGAAYYKLNRYEQAIASHQRAIQLQPNNAINFHNKGAAYFRMQKYQDAKQCFKQSLKRNKRLVLSYSWLADCQKKLNNPQKALQLYEKIYEISGDSIYQQEKRQLQKQLGIKNSKPTFFEKLANIFG